MEGKGKRVRKASIGTGPTKTKSLIQSLGSPDFHAAAAEKAKVSTSADSLILGCSLLSLCPLSKFVPGRGTEEKEEEEREETRRTRSKQIEE